ncbi:hypothetical protein D9M68_772110 [compost metagenome]
MQVVGHLAAGLALDADAVFAAIAAGRQRVVAPHFLAFQLQAQADVLARLELKQRAAVCRHQVQGDDLLAFDDLLRHPEVAGAAPAAAGCGTGGIGAFFGVDQDLRQLAIGGAPGVDHRVGGDLCAEHLANRPQQAAADDRVMFGQDLQRHMLVDDLPDQRAERFQAVDMAGVHQHAVGQCALLVATGLVRLVEQRAYLRVFAEHQLVEVPGQGFAAGFQ